MGLILKCNFAVQEDDVQEKIASAEAAKENKKKNTVDFKDIMDILNQQNYPFYIKHE